MLLDRRRVKFWQKIIFTIMAFLMVIFALGTSVYYIGCSQGGGAVTPNNAVKTAQTRAKKHPASPAARLAVAQAWLTLGSSKDKGSDAQNAAFEKAAASFEQYLRMQKGKSLVARQARIDAISTLAGIYSQTQDYAKLSNVYSRLTELQPGNADNYIYWGQAAEQAGNTSVAALAYQKYLDLAPKGLYAKDIKKKLKELEKQASPSPSP